MSEIIVSRRGELSAFDPGKTVVKDAALSAAIKHAARIKDWPALQEAVNLKINEQREFVIWWESAVQRSGGDRQSKKHSPRSALMLCEAAEEETGVTHQQVSRWRKKLSNVDAYREKLFGKAYQYAMDEEHNHRAQGTGENEWYTPSKYIELARAVLGEIDLDPASSEEAQKAVKAGQYFTRATNGLQQEWHGRVWLNPPYSQPDIANFVSKIVEERCADHVTSAIMLTHNYTDTSWFHQAAEIAAAICFTRGRVKFVDAQGNDCAPTQGQAFFYFGDDVPTFAAKFLEVGFTVVGATA